MITTESTFCTVSKEKNISGNRSWKHDVADDDEDEEQMKNKDLKHSCDYLKTFFCTFLLSDLLLNSSFFNNFFYAPNAAEKKGRDGKDCEKSFCVLFYV